MSGRYDDIIHLPHHVSDKHPRMAAIDRAAQFSPFAALTGFGAAIAETGRLTDERIELDEYEKELLNDKLLRIANRLQNHAPIAVTYFQPDEKKSGGAYITVTGKPKKIDPYRHMLVMESGERILFDDIVEIAEQ